MLQKYIIILLYNLKSVYSCSHKVLPKFYLVRDMFFTYVYLRFPNIDDAHFLAAITALSDLRTMNDMVQWSIPNNIPSDCFVYSVNVSGLILISNTSNVQLKLLADVGVRQCSLEELTVTPIVHVQPFNPLTNISTTGRILTCKSAYLVNTC